MIKIKCFYDKYPTEELFKRCIMLDSNNERVDFNINKYNYIVSSLMSDIYYREVVDKFFELIAQAESNPNEVFGDCGQQFCLDFHHDKVIFYHNEFDEEDGFPVLSCSLKMFKTALTAWSAFLQLPRSIHTVLETVIEEE